MTWLLDGNVLLAASLNGHPHHGRVHAWLAELAKRKDGKLATLDEPLSALWPDSTLLIPV